LLSAWILNAKIFRFFQLYFSSGRLRAQATSVFLVSYL
jgi:hypothetical protein